jgi:hypothetical protein
VAAGTERRLVLDAAPEEIEWLGELRRHISTAGGWLKRIIALELVLKANELA